MYVPLSLPVTQTPADQSQDIAVYTVKPQNQLSIYRQDSESTFKLLHVEHFENGSCPPFSDSYLPHQQTCWATSTEIDINEPEDILKGSVIDWVTAFLHTVLESETSAEAGIQLYLPTEDLRADRENEYNSVRDQIMNQLAVLSDGKTRIVLAGSSDPESANGILDPVLDVTKSEFSNRIKCMPPVNHGGPGITANYGLDLVTVKYDSNTVDIALERWEGSEGQGKAIKGEVVVLFRAEPVTINRLYPFLDQCSEFVLTLNAILS